MHGAMDSAYIAVVECSVGGLRLDQIDMGWRRLLRTVVRRDCVGAASPKCQTRDCKTIRHLERVQSASEKMDCGAHIRLANPVAAACERLWGVNQSLRIHDLSFNEKANTEQNRMLDIFQTASGSDRLLEKLVSWRIHIRVIRIFRNDALSKCIRKMIIPHLALQT